jgi:hypothetical chaperone protein
MRENIGLDFGTTNSALGHFDGEKVHLAQFEGRVYTPSTVFYNYEQGWTSFGRDAVEEYLDQEEGRIMWSPKNILGTRLMGESTGVYSTSVPFRKVILDIIENLGVTYEGQFDNKPQRVVCGRPVYFNDNDKELDTQAQTMLGGILTEIGYNEVEFELEPIAAAISYEQQLQREQIALIVDIGGGTSDFTVIRLNKYDPSRTGNRKKDILSVGGVHIGGTTFDQRLNYKAVMPHLGLNTTYINPFGKELNIPPSIFHTLSTWHKINDIYSAENTKFVQQMARAGKRPQEVSRLLDVVNSQYGHALSRQAEEAKINLTSAKSTTLTTDGLENDFSISIGRSELNEAIARETEDISTTVRLVMKEAGLDPKQIDVVFLTGGSSQVPIVQKSILDLIPDCKIVSGDTFGSVVSGLAITAHDIFR